MTMLADTRSILIAMLLVDALFALFLLGGSDAFYQENGLIENAQLVALALAAYAHGSRVGRAGTLFDRRLLVALCILAVCTFYREGDLRSLVDPGGTGYRALEWFHAFISPLMWLGAALALAHCLGRDLRRTLRFAFADAGLLVGAAFGLVALAAGLDKGILYLPGPKLFFEETLEFTGYMALLAAAFAQTAAFTGFGWGRPAPDAGEAGARP